jgi:hypothetical protein
LVLEIAAAIQLNNMSRKPPAKNKKRAAASDRNQNSRKARFIPESSEHLNALLSDMIKLILKEVGEQERLTECGGSKNKMFEYLTELHSEVYGDEEDDDEPCALVCLEKGCYSIIKKKLCWKATCRG